MHFVGRICTGMERLRALHSIGVAMDSTLQTMLEEDTLQNGYWRGTLKRVGS